jgi:hypothetical protein
MEQRTTVVQFQGMSDGLTLAFATTRDDHTPVGVDT